MYTEAELRKQSNAALNRIIDGINVEIKRRGLKKPRLKKSGNKQTRIDRILGYYAPKPVEPEPEEEKEVPVDVEMEIGDQVTLTLTDEDGEVKEERVVTDDAERFYNQTFALPSGCPEIRAVQADMKDGFLDDGDFVRWAYLKVLGREPDPNGKTVYVGHLKRGTLNRQGLISALFSSDEFRGKRSEGFFDKLRHE